MARPHPASAPPAELRRCPDSRTAKRPCLGTPGGPVRNTDQALVQDRTHGTSMSTHLPKEASDTEPAPPRGTAIVEPRGGQQSRQFQ